MLRGKLLAARRGAVVVMCLLSLCAARQATSPRPASAQTTPPTPCTTTCPGLASTFNSAGSTFDDDQGAAGSNTGGFDGGGANFSRDQLAAAGAVPGALIRSQGVTFTFPNVAASTTSGGVVYDNTVVEGQTIPMSGSGILGFLVAASYPSGNYVTATGGTITYTDGTTAGLSITAPNWWNCPAVSGTAVAITTGHSNNPYDPTYPHCIYSYVVSLTAGKTLMSVTLPPGPPLAKNQPTAHVFAIATSSPGPTLLSQGKHATSSGDQAGFPPFQAVDGDVGTRWGSPWGLDDQWLEVDLGYVATISQVVLYWETSYSTKFNIEVSMNDVDWTPIASGLDGANAQWTGGTGRQQVNVTGSGRYVRMFGFTRSNATYGMSLWEFQVYGTPPTVALSPDVSVGYDHACAILPGQASNLAGQVYCWGGNHYGALGTGSSTPSYESTAVQATALSTTPAQVTTGYHYTCMLNTSAKAYCLGRNDDGQLTNANAGNPVLTPTTPVTGTYGLVSAGYNSNSRNPPNPPLGTAHTCALDTSRVAYCWGANSYGQLGTGNTNDSATPAAVTVPSGATFTTISAGTDHACGVASTGFAYCWGRNSDGKLGCSSTVNPTACPLTSGQSSAPVAVDTTGVLSDKTVIQISAGDTHTCAVTLDGTAACWGDNSDGQLGCGPACGTSSNVPVQVLTAPGMKWSQISAGSDFTCAINYLGQAWCWGLGADGQVGNHDNESQVSPVPVATSPGEPTSELPDTAFLAQISSGYASTCVMDLQSNVYCWGLGKTGQLGNGDIRNSNVPVQVITQPVGELTITCPAQAPPLGSGTPGGTVTGDLGEVTVTDNRTTGAAAQWTVTASATGFTSATTTFTIPAGNVTYTIPPDSFTAMLPASATPDNLAASGVPLFGSLPVLAADAVSGPIRAVTWDPVITVNIPYSAPPGKYQGEIIHSVY